MENTNNIQNEKLKECTIYFDRHLIHEFLESVKTSLRE